MKRIELDLSEVALRYELHLALRNAFGFPEYYGMNLDALHDCLTDIREDTEISIKGTENLISSLGKYGEIALKVIKISAEENPHLLY